MFAAVSTPQLAEIARSARTVRLARGEVLFHAGAESNGFYCVITGQMKLAISTSDGHEKVIEIIQPCQSFGEAAMFSGRPFPVTAEALVATEVVFLPSQALFGLLDSDPAFARQMLAGLSGRLHALVRDVETYSLKNATQRLVGYLLQCVDPPADPYGRPTVHLEVSKQVVASRLNLTPETFSRILNQLRSEGLIEVDGKCVQVLDLPALRRY